VFSVVFVAEKVDAVGEVGSGDITMFYVQTLLEVFLDMPLRSAFSIGEAFSGKKQTSGPVTAVLTCWIVRIPELYDVRLTESFCSIHDDHIFNSHSTV
jgi:hypothetical protein